MGNLMIGNEYPSSLGGISKIMCGSEQCWPQKKDLRFKRLILCDNPINKTQLAVDRIRANGSDDDRSKLVYNGKYYVINMRKRTSDYYVCSMDIYGYDANDGWFTRLVYSNYVYFQNDYYNPDWYFRDDRDVYVYLDWATPPISDNARTSFIFKWTQEDRKGNVITIPVTFTYGEAKSDKTFIYKDPDSDNELEVTYKATTEGVKVILPNSASTFYDYLHEGWVRNSVSFEGKEGVTMSAEDNNPVELFIPYSCFAEPSQSTPTAAYIYLHAKRAPVVDLYINSLFIKTIVLHENMAPLTFSESFKLVTGENSNNTWTFTLGEKEYASYIPVTVKTTTNAPKSVIWTNSQDEQYNKNEYTVDLGSLNFDSQGSAVKKSIYLEVTPVLEDNYHVYEIVFRTPGTIYKTCPQYSVIDHIGIALKEGFEGPIYLPNGFKVNVSYIKNTASGKWQTVFSGINNSEYSIYNSMVSWSGQAEVIYAPIHTKPWTIGFQEISVNWKQDVRSVEYYCDVHQDTWSLSVNGVPLLNKILTGDNLDTILESDYQFPDGIFRKVKWHIQSDGYNYSCTVDTGSYPYTFEDSRWEGSVIYSMASYTSLNTNIIVQ